MLAFNIPILNTRYLGPIELMKSPAARFHFCLVMLGVELSNHPSFECRGRGSSAETWRHRRVWQSQARMDLIVRCVSDGCANL